MKIGILGTGMVGRAFALRLTELNHDCFIGTRNVKNTLACTESDSKGTKPYFIWANEHKDIPLVSFADAAKDADIIINAISGENTLAALAGTGVDILASKIILDLALPLDYSQGRPPHLAFANTDSLGEQVQRMLPQSYVVKTLNTMSNTIMLYPQSLPEKHNVFLSGDNELAKAKVKMLLGEFGWSDESIIDLGGIITARSTEMYANLLFCISAVIGTYDFNISIIKRGKNDVGI